MTTALLSSAYCAPVQWFQKLNRYDRVLIEQHDNFRKQTYRNRCVIATANGTQALTIPVENTAGGKCLRRAVRVSDHGNWRRLHWNALATAYGDSPFFDYYADDLHPMYVRKYDFLLDFNMEMTRLLCQLLDVRPQVELTTAYTAEAENDFRDVIRPKHPVTDDGFVPRRYYQVHGAARGFIPNLSVLDLLFNMGNEAIFYL